MKAVCGDAYAITVLKSMIPTASLVIPSPNITLKSFGYCSYFTTAMAATTSDEQIKLHISNISIIDSSKGTYCLKIFKLRHWRKEGDLLSHFIVLHEYAKTVKCEESKRE